MNDSTWKLPSAHDVFVGNKYGNLPRKTHYPRRIALVLSCMNFINIPLLTLSQLDGIWL